MFMIIIIIIIIIRQLYKAVILILFFIMRNLKNLILSPSFLFFVEHLSDFNTQ